MNSDQIRQTFPVLAQEVNQHPYTYLDSAATTLKPRCVIDAMQSFYENRYATVHRGAYQMSANATTEYQNVRQLVAKFINADPKEVIFVKGCTEAINLVAYSYGQLLPKGSTILISEIEHHANILPWQQIRDRYQLQLKTIRVTDQGELDLAHLESLLKTELVSLVAIAHVSNVVGTIHPIKAVIDLAHRYEAKVLIDAAQAVPHLSVDFKALDCDFYCFSGHKIYGPTGVGILAGKYELLEQMPPYQTGGDMITEVTFEHSSFAKPPLRFEAGTPAFVEVIGLGAAIEFLNSIGMDQIRSHEEQLLSQATKALQEVPGLKIIGTATQKAAVISFVIDGLHPFDIGSILDMQGIAIRIGHHCSQPAMRRFGIDATARASFGVYNTQTDVQRFVDAIHKCISMIS